MQKRCSKCRRVKSLSAFNRDTHRKDQRTCQCRECQHEYYLSKRPYFRRRSRDCSLKRRFSITRRQYNAMLLAQSCVCAICGHEEMRLYKGRIRQMSVDHDHTTGTVRALLCYRCNSVLGFSQDDPARLRRAAAYLEYHKALGRKL